MIKFKPRTLNHALALLLALITVPLLLGALGLMVIQVRQSQQAQQTHLMALARTLAKAVESDFEHRKSQLEVIASSRIFERRDWQGLHTMGQALARQKPDSVLFLVAPDGQQLLSTLVPFDQALPNIWQDLPQQALWAGKALPLSVTALTKEVFRTGQVGYSDLYVGMFMREPRLAVAVPVVRDGQILYVMGVSFRPNAVEALIESAINVPGIRASVSDPAWTTVASNAASSFRMADKVTAFPIDQTLRAGSFEMISSDGVMLNGAYALATRKGFVVRTSVARQGLLASLRDASSGWLLLALATVVLSALLMGLISRRFANPLKELHAAARDGRAPRGPATGVAEIDIIAQALRAGVQAEQQRREEMALNLERQHQEAALRKSNREKDEFLATLAHELRNPLAPIRTAAAVIGQQALNPPAVVKAHAIIERQAVHLTRLVDDLLDVSRISLGTVALQTQTLDLNELASQAVDLVQNQADAAGLRLTLSLADAPLLVDGDAVRLGQCLSNLLHNAIKFTPAGGGIALGVHRQPGSHACIVVRDEGKGIAKDDLERIFEVFVQTHISGSQGYSGLGIGLALTRKLIKLHGGSIAAKSDGLGQGSVFEICLPALTERPAPPTPPTPTAPTPSPAEPIGAPTTALLPGPGSANAKPPAAPSSPQPLVLVVDDNEDAANMLSEVITLSGFRAQSVYTGESALQAMADCMPAAVLLDIGLPDISGYEVCQRLRSWKGVQPLVIAVTGWGQTKDRAESRAVGFDAHLTKPTDPQLIVNMLEETLG